MPPTSGATRREFLGQICAVTATVSARASVAGSSRIRLGQIGTKHAHAAGKLAAVLKYPEIFEWVGLVEPDPAQRAAVQEQAPYRGQRWLSEAELLATPGLQAVVVETEVAELVPTATRCLRAGLHVHVDKPAGSSLAACRAMHAEAQARGLTLQMGYMFRYNPAFAFAHRIVRAGWLGEITEVSGMIGKLANEAQRRELAAFAGGGMFELGCHLVDQVVALLGAPEKVSAFTRRSRPGRDTFADNQLAVFDYPGAIATICCNHLDPLGGERRQFSITGTLGTFEIRPLEPPRARLGLDRPRGEYRKGFQDVGVPPAGGRYDEEFVDLARVIRGEKKLAWDAAHDLATHEAVLRAAGML